MSPTGDDVRRQLDRLLASSGFANAGRMSRFLKFVVERTLAGEGERLKEYVIGVEVFDRDTNYDPRVDSIVRVEAARLRTKLAEYYAGEGRGDAVVLTLPKGGYAAVIKLDEHAGAINGAPVTNGTASLATPAPPFERTPRVAWRRRGPSASAGRAVRHRRSHRVGAEPRARAGAAARGHAVHARGAQRGQRGGRTAAHRRRHGRARARRALHRGGELRGARRVFVRAPATRRRRGARRRHRRRGAYHDGRRAGPRRGASRERPDGTEAMGPGFAGDSADTDALEREIAAAVADELSAPKSLRLGSVFRRFNYYKSINCLRSFLECCAKGHWPPGARPLLRSRHERTNPPIRRNRSTQARDIGSARSRARAASAARRKRAAASPPRSKRSPSSAATPARRSGR